MDEASANDLAERWIELVNTQDAELGAALLADDITIIAYEQGKGGSSRQFDCADEVMAWITRPQVGKFRLELLSADFGPPCDRLPAADVTVHAHYRVRIVEEADFENVGDWQLAFASDRLVGVLHEPEPLKAW